MYNAEKHACSNLPRIYGFIDKSVFAIVLQTCNNIDIPPRPRRKEAIIMFIDKFFSGMLHIIFKPFVNSRIPEMKPVQNVEGICSKLKICCKLFDNICNNWLACIIEIITENSTTNPPIKRIVFIELEMLFPMIPPKFERLILSFVLDHV